MIFTKDKGTGGVDHGLISKLYEIPEGVDALT